MNIVIRPDGTLALAQDSAIRASGTPLTTPPIYGHGGLFGMAGIDPVVVNAMVGPIGMERELQFFGSDVQTPFYDTLMYIGSSGYAQDTLCGDCGKPSFKEAVQSACFGRLCQSTNEHAVDMLGMRGTFAHKRVALFNPVTDAAGNTIIPKGAEIQDKFLLEVAGMGYGLRLRVATELWTGNPAANLGGHWEAPGLLLIINNGKTDASSGLAAPGLNSYVATYGNAIVGAPGSPSIVRSIAAMIRSVKFRAQSANMSVESIDDFLVMHPRHWDCIADAWACEYGLICQNTTVSAPTRNDSLALADVRDTILREMSLPIDGKRIRVVLDSQLPSTPVPYGNVTAWRGSILYIIKSIEGQTVLWGEYQDFNKTFGASMAWLKKMVGNVPLTITDGGRFIVAGDFHGGLCFDAKLLTKTRYISIMPWLLGRLDNVGCVPLGTYPDVTGSGGLYDNMGGTQYKPYLGIYGDCGNLDELHAQ